MAIEIILPVIAETVRTAMAAARDGLETSSSGSSIRVGTLDNSVQNVNSGSVSGTLIQARTVNTK